MKQLLFVLLFSTILIGCNNQIKNEDPKEENQDIIEQEQLSFEKATEIAYQDAGVKENQVTDFKIDYDTDFGVPIVKVKFEANEIDYKYKIAMDGHIRQVQKDGDSDINPQVSVSKEEIKQYLLSKYPDAYNFEFERDDEDGEPVWEIEFEDQNYEYEITISAIDKQIFDFSKDQK